MITADIPYAEKCNTRVIGGHWVLSGLDGFYEFRVNGRYGVRDNKSDVLALYDGGFATFTKVDDNSELSIKNLRKTCKKIDKLMPAVQEVNRLKKKRDALLARLKNEVENLLRKNKKYKLRVSGLIDVIYQSYEFTVWTPSVSNSPMTEHFVLSHNYKDLFDMWYGKHTPEEFVDAVNKMIPQMAKTAKRANRSIPPNSRYRDEVKRFVNSLRE